MTGPAPCTGAPFLARICQQHLPPRADARARPAALFGVASGLCMFVKAVGLMVVGVTHHCAGDLSRPGSMAVLLVKVRRRRRSKQASDVEGQIRRCSLGGSARQARCSVTCWLEARSDLLRCQKFTARDIYTSLTTLTSHCTLCWTISAHIALGQILAGIEVALRRAIPATWHRRRSRARW